MAFADVNGKQLYFEDVGGDGPPVNAAIVALFAGVGA
jgi:hypothetical protein